MAARNNMAGAKASSSSAENPNANPNSASGGGNGKNGKEAAKLERKPSKDTVETKQRDTTITVYLSNEIPVTMVQFEPILELLGEKHPAL